VSTGRPLLAAVLVSAALALLGVGVAWTSSRHVEQSVHRRYAAARNDHVGHDCWGRSPSASREGCALGDAGSATTIALIGDSHASHWLGGLERAGQAHGWRIEPYVMGACPVADLRGLIRGAAARLYQSCARFQEATMRRLEAARPSAVILSNADYYLAAEPIRISESVWIQALRRSYERLERMGIDVVVIRDVPLVPFDVPSCLSRRAARLPLATDCQFAPDQAFIARARRAQDRAALGLSVRFIDMNDQVCPGGSARCATERDGMVLYTDDDHISASFARSLGVVLGQRIAATVGR
jgi:hypothetical protein